ncbi:MAG TPA: NADH-quinone oxidoreductase subunit N [Candidatus Polarisedimenticolia bacterium]|nr:NADH-quinone oxidoreductase subunit N [Candidatus Polarisedimenticolia bacterium]
MEPTVAGLLQDSIFILPELLLYAFAFLILIVSALLPPQDRKMIAWLSLVGTAMIVPMVVRYARQLEGSAGSPVFSGDVAVDGLGFFFKLIVLAGGLLSIMISIRYLDIERMQAGEYYALIMIATASMMFMASSLSLLMIFVSLETMALSVYILVGFLKENRKSNEAALKYFVLGAFSSAIFVYGASLVYGSTGSLQLDAIAKAAVPGGEGVELTVVGLILITVALGFKVAAVPFHMYIPDAYEGAPTAVTAFISTASKAAAFVVALRVFVTGFPGLFEYWAPLVALLSAASMTLGNVTAILQDNMKRMLAYSSIAHAGYALMGLLVAGQPGAAGDFGMKAVGVYMMVYTFMNIGAFGLVIMLRRRDLVGDLVIDFSGLAKRSPVAAFTMLLFLLSLAGIPPLAGFMGKWYLFGAAVRGDWAWLAVLAVINSAISLYYYLRVVVCMYLKDPLTDEPFSTSLPLNAALAIAGVMTVLLGIWPEHFLRLATFSWSLASAAGP